MRASRLPAAMLPVAFAAVWCGAMSLGAPAFGASVLGAQASSPREPFRGLDAYVDSALRTWKVPGLALALVRHDSVIYARGYGVRELGKPDPVDPRTVFAIGSSTKAFTAAAVAMLVDEKKVRLDAPAAAYLPTFQLYDPYASRELTVRDLLTHRSGLARGELVWYGSGYSRDEILRHVRFLQPTTSFRSQFGYQNMMYIAAGQVVAHTANTTWDDFVAQRILMPLGMSATSTTQGALAGVRDLAAPHGEIADTLRVVPRRSLDNAGPAGSINSTALDMAQWVRLQLGRGVYAGRRLVSDTMMREMHTPQTIVPIDTAARRLNPYTHFSDYGLGWFIEDYRGHEVWQHGGNVDGFTALVGMLPDEELGLVILTNMNGSGLPMALMHRVFDLQLKAPPRDWSVIMHARTEQFRAKAKAAERKLEAERIPNTRPSLPLTAYTGTYLDSLYGAVQVREANGQLLLDYGPTWHGALQHWHFNIFRTRFDTPVIPPFFVEFRPTPAAKVDEVQLEIVGVPMTFHRLPLPRPRPDSAATAAAAATVREH